MCLQINMFSAIKLNVSMLCTFCWNNITCNNHVTHNNVVDFTISADIRLDYVVCSWAYLIPYGVFSPLSDRELSFFCFFGSLRETYADGGGGIPPLEPTPIFVIIILLHKQIIHLFFILLHRVMLYGLSSANKFMMSRVQPLLVTLPCLSHHCYWVENDT